MHAKHFTLHVLTGQHVRDECLTPLGSKGVPAAGYRPLMRQGRSDLSEEDFGVLLC
jgi:hypothetical protein